MRFLGSVVASFNMEITNRCAIACPECARTNNPWLRRNLTELPLDLLKRIFPLSAADSLRGNKFLMSCFPSIQVYRIPFRLPE